MLFFFLKTMLNFNTILMFLRMQKVNAEIFQAVCPSHHSTVPSFVLSTGQDMYVLMEMRRTIYREVGFD